MELKKFNDWQEKIVGIFACDKNYGIGKDNDLPWPRHKEDMKFFKDSTEGCIIVMGRKTWESLGSKPLPKRLNFVVSNDPSFEATGAEVIRTSADADLKSAIYALSAIHSEARIYIIGGKFVLEELTPIMDGAHVTIFDKEYDCDTYINKSFFIRHSRIWGTTPIDGGTIYQLGHSG